MTLERSNEDGQQDNPSGEVGDGTVNDRPVKNYVHQPVLLQEIARDLQISGDGVFFDFTVGGAGHLEALAKSSAPGASLYGMDRDSVAVTVATERLSTYPQVKRIINAPFSTFSEVKRELEIETISGALFDLGVSSPQIDWAERGFSFQGEAPLDMRMDQRQTATASELINELDAFELASLFWKYGEERRSRKIASAIVHAREDKSIITTSDLKAVISSAVGPANLTRTLARIFQALRIAVNQELTELESALPKVIDALRLGGRLAVISYHSLEDRIVKHTFASYAGACTCPPGMPICTCNAQRELKQLTKKPIVASEEEIKSNPRARSAKLRIAERVALPINGEAADGSKSGSRH